MGAASFRVSGTVCSSHLDPLPPNSPSRVDCWPPHLGTFGLHTITRPHNRIRQFIRPLARSSFASIDAHTPPRLRYLLGWLCTASAMSPPGTPARPIQSSSDPLTRVPETPWRPTVSYSVHAPRRQAIARIPGRANNVGTSHRPMVPPNRRPLRRSAYSSLRVARISGHVDEQIWSLFIGHTVSGPFIGSTAVLLGLRCSIFIFIQVCHAPSTRD